MDVFKLIEALEVKFPEASQAELDAHYSYITGLCRFQTHPDGVIYSILDVAYAAMMASDGIEGMPRLKNELENRAKALGNVNHRFDIQRRTKAIEGPSQE